MLDKIRDKLSRLKCTECGKKLEDDDMAWINFEYAPTQVYCKECGKKENAKKYAEMKGKQAVAQYKYIRELEKALRTANEMAYINECEKEMHNEAFIELKAKNEKLWKDNMMLTALKLAVEDRDEEMKQLQDENLFNMNLTNKLNKMTVERDEYLKKFKKMQSDNIKLLFSNSNLRETVKAITEKYKNDKLVQRMLMESKKIIDFGNGIVLKTEDDEE